MNELAIDQTQINLMEELNRDSLILGTQTEKFLNLAYPSYLIQKHDVEDLLEQNSMLRLQSMTFFRIDSCTADTVEKVFENINERFEKLLTALHSIDIPIAYGLISRNGMTNLVLGVYSPHDVAAVTTITRGMLSGISMQEISPDFSPRSTIPMSHGILTGVPSLYVDGQKQTFSLASIMRSLNGQNYTLLFIAKPVGKEIISQNISELLAVKDAAFAISKRNIARSSTYSKNIAESLTIGDTEMNIAGSVGGGAGAAAGVATGALLGLFVLPGIGAAAGAAIGGAMGGSLGTLIGSLAGMGKSHSEGISQSISEAITAGETISSDIQNSFALELMDYADNAIERLKGGQNNGIWQTAIAYSAESPLSRNIIRACLCSELSKLDAKKLPMLAFEPKATPEILSIPDFLEEELFNPLCSYLNSAELGLLCTVPTESVPDFELRLERKFPLLASKLGANDIPLGHVVDGKRPMENMPFALSEQDLNKHTFVCGITGSGKTTTVKKMLIEAKKPFLVIESAKKEYRNIAVDTTVYTLGKPEINAPQLNPFYIMPGVSPQLHIDYLKDLFNASFSFYGPMSYILEKCLHSVYKNKGWDLTLGYHPLLANVKSSVDFFSIDHIKTQYAKLSHKFLFPTMQELKDEIARYIDEELKYDGEVAGNIKTAMKVRLENLCVGAKGYTFNTSDFIDFTDLLEKNVVFELEGLADDSDKAFSVGLLVIFINEYRQVQKELNGRRKKGLQHLLVIEEAHRLLKNVDTERFSETSGNPKGKAVEHFTNMIAEMRSYGQGVIVAEQIPTKLAPDVIKNSSTKIVQRIVSADDQQVIANTIGITGKDAVQLGFLETGYAYCHKEGMMLPTPVKIQDTVILDGVKQDIDVFVTDEELYNTEIDRFEKINLSTIRNSLGDTTWMKQKALSILNTLMIENEDNCIAACDMLVNDIENKIKQNDLRLTLSRNTARLCTEYLAEVILTLMSRGVYCAKTLPDDAFVTLLEKTFYAPSHEKIKEVKEHLQNLYAKDLSSYAKRKVTALITCSMNRNTDIPGTIRNYFIVVSDSSSSEIETMIKGG